MDTINLAAEIRKGNEWAFTQAFDLLHAKLFFYTLHHTHSRELSTELVQQTFIKLWRSRKGLVPELDISIQLFRIAKTTWIDMLRTEARHRKRIVPLSPAQEALPDTAVPVPREQMAVLRGRIRMLPESQKEIINYKLEGFSNQEIADRLLISKKTVENQVNKAFSSLRNSN